MPRLAAPALAAALLAGAALATSAFAATAVTSPADGAAFAGGSTIPATFAASGTATLETAVELRCGAYWAGSWHWSSPLEGAESIPVAGGRWTAPAVVVPADEVPCRLLAFNAGDGTPSVGEDPAPGRTGPRLRFVTAAGQELGSGPDPTRVLDAALAVGGTAGATYAWTAGSFGVQTSLIGPRPSADGADVFEDANRLRTLDPQSPVRSGNGTRLGLQVDGVNAYVGGSWIEAGGLGIPFNAYLDLPTVTAVPSVAADGSLVVTEHDEVRRCTATEPSAYPLGGFSCGNSLADPGVALDLVTTVSPAGTSVWRAWTLRSTDGAAHSARLVLTQTAATNGATQREWRVAGGGWAPRANGDVVNSPTAPFSMAFRRVGGPEPDPLEGLGAVTFGAVPAELRFTGARVLVASYDVAVPAGGAAQLPFVLSSEESLAALDAAIAAAESSLGSGGVDPGPGGRGGPGPGGGSSGPNGDPGKGGGGGADAPPGGGDPGPGGRQRAAALPRVTWRGKPSLRRGKLSLGATLECPGSGPACSAKLTLSAKPAPAKRGQKGTKKRKPAKPKVLARGNVRLAAGKRVALTLKVKQSKAALKRGRPSVSIAARRGTQQARTATRAIAVR